MQIQYFVFFNLLFISYFSSLISVDKITMAEKIREEGKTLEALNLFNESIVENQQLGDYHKVLSAMMGEIICWQHQFNRTKSNVYAILAKKKRRGYDRYRRRI